VAFLHHFMPLLHLHMAPAIFLHHHLTFPHHFPPAAI
jgi:hypothetical protein